MKRIALLILPALGAIAGLAGAAAAAPLVQPSVTAMDMDALFSITMLVAIAVAGVVGIGDRAGLERRWYIVGLASGVLIAWPLVGWPASLPIGLGASAVVQPVVKFYRARLARPPVIPPESGRP